MSERSLEGDVWAAMQTLSQVIPQMRAGQLVAAVGELCVDLHGRGLWDASDAEMLEAIWQFQRSFESATAPAISVPVEPR